MKEVIDQDTITNGGESSQFETKEVPCFFRVFNDARVSN